MISAERTRTLDYWLGITMRELREEQHVKRSEVAARMLCAEVTVLNFEKGKTRPREVDQFLAAYAELLGVQDPLDFYDIALARMRSDGLPPRVEIAEGTPMSRAVDAAKRARRESRSPRGGSQRKLVAISTFLGQAG
jgi:transcriptional regulator with XRE-family HTH domain